MELPVGEREKKGNIRIRKREEEEQMDFPKCNTLM
jgi:hypothetical protein